MLGIFCEYGKAVVDAVGDDGLDGRHAGGNKQYRIYCVQQRTESVGLGPRYSSTEPSQVMYHYPPSFERLLPSWGAGSGVLRVNTLTDVEFHDRYDFPSVFTLFRYA